MVEKDLGQIIPDVTAIATIDDTVGTPEVNITVEELEELGRLVNKFKFNFLHLKGEKGDKPQKGVDYYTTQEKEQFTAEAKALVTGEGTKQVSLINAETAKVIQQVKEIVAGNAATTNALTLNGKTRLEFEKEIQGLAGGYNGIFPLKKAELNGIYLFPSTGKLYVCIKNYNGSQLTAPNANFEELSVYTNRSKLDNLSNINAEHSYFIGNFSLGTSIDYNALEILFPVDNGELLIYDLVLKLSGGYNRGKVAGTLELSIPIYLSGNKHYATNVTILYDSKHGKCFNVERLVEGNICGIRIACGYDSVLTGITLKSNNINILNCTTRFKKINTDGFIWL